MEINEFEKEIETSKDAEFKSSIQHLDLMYVWRDLGKQW